MFPLLFYRRETQQNADCSFLFFFCLLCQFSGIVLEEGAGGFVKLRKCGPTHLRSPGNVPPQLSVPLSPENRIIVEQRSNPRYPMFSDKSAIPSVFLLLLKSYGSDCEHPFLAFSDRERARAVAASPQPVMLAAAGLTTE